MNGRRIRWSISCYQLIIGGGLKQSSTSNHLLLSSLSRTSDMVDVISTRFQGMYGSWNYFNNNTDGGTAMNRSTSEKVEKKQERVCKEGGESREESRYMMKDPSTTPGSTADTMNSEPTSFSLSCRSCSPGQSVSSPDLVKCHGFGISNPSRTYNGQPIKLSFRGQRTARKTTRSEGQVYRPKVSRADTIIAIFPPASIA